jgi:hypothetical protein
VQRELLAFPTIPRVPRNVIQIQVVAGAGTVTPVPPVHVDSSCS